MLAPPGTLSHRTQTTKSNPQVALFILPSSLHARIHPGNGHGEDANKSLATPIPAILVVPLRKSSNP
jgi:hypothetical protein